MTETPLFTAIVHTYNRPALLKTAVEALQKQTYANLEIILINNGATPESVEYLEQVAAADNRIKLINFDENQFSWDDPAKYVEVCWNAALAASTGEYVWVQEDDDFLAEDYAEKMVALFQENPECTTAAGLPFGVDIEGQVNEVQSEGTNQRSRFTEGQELALDYLSPTSRLFSAPGTIFTIKREVLIQAGGYHKATEASHIYGIVPFGVTGFDPSALFFWRHHEGQINKMLTDSGAIGIDYALSLVGDWQLEKRWSVFGPDVAKDLVRKYKNRTFNGAARWFVLNIYGFRLLQAFRIVRKMWFRPYFWYRALVHGLNRKHYTQAIGPLVKPPIKGLFRMLPALGKLTPGLGRLSVKVDRWN